MRWGGASKTTAERRERTSVGRSELGRLDGERKIATLHPLLAATNAL